jgi:hypothetical protein
VFFSFLDEKKLLALYQDSTIYVSSQYKDDQIILSLIHEIGHCVEDIKGYDIYIDKELKKEFVRKRLAFYDNLKYHDCPLMSLSKYYISEYNEDFENYLYNDLGYNVILSHSINLFLSPHSISSLKEYFTIGFEYYFGIKNQKENIKTFCPVLYKKLKELEEIRN